jgi:hypothetical protein
LKVPVAYRRYLNFGAQYFPDAHSFDFSGSKRKRSIKYELELDSFSIEAKTTYRGLTPYHYITKSQ